MVHLDLYDVAVLGDGPVWAIWAVGCVMHRVLATQPREIGPPNVIVVQHWIADIDLVERHRVSVFARVEVHFGVHGVLLKCPSLLASVLPLRHVYGKSGKLLAHPDLAGQA